MKIAVCSDLHLEFGDLFFENTEQAKVLILSGDIIVANNLQDRDPYDILEGTRSDRYHKFFQRCSEQFEHVVYVCGNHEFYNGDIATDVDKMRKQLAYLDNVHLLQNDTFTLDDTIFVGGTLWTDVGKSDELSLYHIQRSMNDFRLIRNSNRTVYRNVPLYEYDENGKVKYNENGSPIQVGSKKKADVARFCPEDSVVEHKKMLEYISFIVSENKDKKIVVVGHHAPSSLSIAPEYAGDTLMNNAYYSDLSEFILDRPEIVLWTHGHVHTPFDYVIGETRVVCNPRGYIGHERQAHEFELKYVEI